MLFVLLTFGPRFGSVPWAALPIGVMILGALHLNVGEVLQHYQLKDQLGQETSFPLEGGSVQIFCNSTDTRVTFLRNLTAEKVTNKNDVELKNPLFRLESGLVGTQYKCKGFDSGKLEIGPLHCDPFALIPNVTKCSEKQWCLIGKDGQARCEDKTEKACFLGGPLDVKEKFNESLPKFKAVCSIKGQSAINSFGVCEALSKGSEILGFSDTANSCGMLKSLMLNNVRVYPAKILFIPVTEKKWKIEFKGKGTVTCTLKDNSNKSYVDIKPFASDTLIRPKFGNVQLPIKLEISCVKLSPADYSFLIEGFVIVFDPDISKYGVSISKKLKTGHLELGCSCDVPEGFVCGLTWEEPKISDALQEMPEPPGKKKLSRKDHARPIVYTCFMRVLAFDYPYTFKLKPVPLGIKHKQANVTVDANDFDEGSEGSSDNDGDNGAGKGKPGNGKDGKGKNNNNENKSNEDSASNKTATIAAAIAVTLVLLLAAAAIIVTVMVVLRRRKRAREEEELEQQLEIQRKKGAKRHERDMSFINSIKDSPDKVTEPFLTKFYQQRDRIPNEVLKDADLLYKHLKKLPDCKIITIFWDRLEAYVPGELKKLDTRYEDEVLVETWLFKDHVITQPTKGKNAPKPEVLHVNIVTDLFMVPRYLVCQAPKITEMQLYLNTLAKQKVTLVVCLLARGERRGRYFDYFSLSVGESQTYGDTTLSCISVCPTAHFITRRMEIQMGENKHSLCLLRYLDWVDFGGGDPAHVLLLRKSMTDIENKYPGMTLIHCSAGVGRTGCLLASLLCLQMFDFNGLPFDIAAICLKVRKERYKAIQRFTQYALVYWVVAEYAKRQLRQIAPQEKTELMTLRPEPITIPKVSKDSKSPTAAKDKQRSSASIAQKVTPSKQIRASK